MVMTMRSLRSFLFTLGGLTFVAVAALFTASIALAVTGAVTVLVLGQWLAGLFGGSQPEPVRAYARPRRTAAERHAEALRIWNDGKGTIIDM